MELNHVCNGADVTSLPDYLGRLTVQFRPIYGSYFISPSRCCGCCALIYFILNRQYPITNSLNVYTFTLTHSLYIYIYIPQTHTHAYPQFLLLAYHFEKRNSKRQQQRKTQQHFSLFSSQWRIKDWTMEMMYDTYMGVCPAVDPLSSTKNQGCHVYAKISQHALFFYSFFLPLGLSFLVLPAW